MKSPKSIVEKADHFHVEPHQGPAFKVAKKGLSPKVMHRLQGMCMGGPVKMADGGPVMGLGDQGDATNPLDFTTGGEQSFKMGDPGTANLPTFAEPVNNPEVSDADRDAALKADVNKQAWGVDAPPQQAPAPAAPSIGGGYGVNEQKELKQAEDKRLAGASALAGVQGEQGKQEAAALQSYQDAMLAKQAIHDEQAKKIQAEIEQTEQEIKSGKVNPNNWFASKDTGGKISAVLSMVLGGIGAGATHGPNMGMEMINKQIDRDISAQKDNLQSKNNLVALYYKKLGNLDEATQRAKADMQAALQVKVQQLGALAKGPVAQANLKALEGQLQEDRLKTGSALASQAAARQLTNIHAAIGKAQLAGAGQAPVPQSIKDRVTFQTSAIASAEKQLEHMEKGDAVKAGVLGGLKGMLPGDRTASNWEAGRNLAVNELAKISKQGVPDKDEVERFLHTVPGASASAAEKKAWIADTRKYLQGQKQALNKQFATQGYKVPYPDAGEDIEETKAIR